MKQANNNEVDLLLRSLARGRNKSESRNGLASEDGSAASSHHLDADELNLFAEGVAPAPARARYTEHLADCEACRSIVVSLTQAAGVAARYEVPSPEAEPGLWQKLTALFSPAVLRYAVPVLLLTAVIGIGLLALRQQRQTELVARNDAQNSAPVAVEPKVTSGVVNPSKEATPSTVPAGNQPQTSIESDKKRDPLQDRKTDLAPAPAAATESAIAKAPLAKDSLQAGEGAGVASSRPYAPEPKTAAPPPAPADMLDANKSGELAREKLARREDEGRSRDDFRNQSVDEHGPNRSRNNNAMPMGQRNVGAVGGRGPSGGDKNKVEVVETRSVSGRRFTREGNAWVDIDYDSSRSTISVTRGSDQFRALVADEPGIRAIANQLSGTIIVVWKNRAYRIQ
jgi:hypothetical protein